MGGHGHLSKDKFLESFGHSGVIAWTFFAWGGHSEWLGEEGVLFLTGRPCPPGETLLAGVETDSWLGMEQASMAKGSGRNTAPRKNKKGIKLQKG